MFQCRLAWSEAAPEVTNRWWDVPFFFLSEFGNPLARGIGMFSKGRMVCYTREHIWKSDGLVGGYVRPDVMSER